METSNEAHVAFANQYCRKFLVELADFSFRFPESDLPISDIHPAYLKVIESNGWLTKREPKRLTAKGWKTATSFLTR